ncbi:Lrp/AsnC family leucine-responsive transcriptional regulator [Chitinivorax tropicus]|uniref:Lrp/AsnC family leucine-responsive transcriptional regulator n=1 Tax=Chitinivorax tropicus TaxID=714531 RepID=A0A840MN42_9PROT|nr:Lrp/AsnC family transcriptional regulator [Chitinivorax tropicus]MBB5018387.1 Lrp/AsnC family leucine-responsive transcriptional regulator [Chitinivorax tropicus]
MSKISLDNYDLQLLALLQENSRLTQYDLAQQVALSPSACYRRVQRLREAGVIQRDAILVNPEDVGQKMRMVLRINLAHEQIHLQQHFHRTVRDAPEVMECYNVTGSADYILIVNVPDMAAFHDFSQRVLHANGNIREYETMVVINTVKYSTTIPITSSDVSGQARAMRGGNGHCQQKALNGRTDGHPQA